MIQNQRNSLSGFTLIELMLAVAIVAILAAVAIPAYIGYLRRSYLSEAHSSISAIKTAEESYFTTHGCYISATQHPSTIPAGIASNWDTGTPAVWGQGGLSVRPDRRVRFSYSVYASNSWDAADPCVAPDATLGNREATVGCASINALVPNAIFPDNWFVVVARGDLDGDGVASNLLSAVDDSAIVPCDETN